MKLPSATCAGKGAAGADRLVSFHAVAERTLILECVHGSRAYGLEIVAHAHGRVAA